MTDARARHLAAPRVVLLGAGPGDPDLLTVKAVKALRRATVALVDDLVGDGVLRYLKRSARIVHVGKRGGCASTPQAFIHRLMVAEARRGESVVRIQGGDPFVFGRGGEECDALRAAGIEVEVISGLTSGIAGPAAVGIPVTDRRHAAGVVLVTGHGQEGETATRPDWSALARCGLTLVIYMGVARVEALGAQLQQAGMAGDTPAAVISAAHTPRQREARCTLATLAATVAAHALMAPAVLVIGGVARLGAAQWSELKPSDLGEGVESRLGEQTAVSAGQVTRPAGSPRPCRRGNATAFTCHNAIALPHSVCASSSLQSICLQYPP